MPRDVEKIPHQGRHSIHVVSAAERPWRAAHSSTRRSLPDVVSERTWCVLAVSHLCAVRARWLQLATASPVSAVRRELQLCTRDARDSATGTADRRHDTGTPRRRAVHARRTNPPDANRVLLRCAQQTV